MAATAFRTKGQNMVAITDIVANSELNSETDIKFILVVRLYVADAEFRPAGDPHGTTTLKTEEEWHKALRGDPQLEYFPEYSTNPEWNLPKLS